MAHRQYAMLFHVELCPAEGRPGAETAAPSTDIWVTVTWPTKKAHAADEQTSYADAIQAINDNDDIAKLCVEVANVHTVLPFTKTRETRFEPMVRVFVPDTAAAPKRKNDNDDEEEEGYVDFD